MKTRWIVLAALMLNAAAAHGDTSKLQVGGLVGGHDFASDIELGVPDEMGTAAPEAGLLIGARVGYWLRPTLAVEGELVVIPTKDDVLGDTAVVLGTRAHVVYSFLPGAKVRPFGLAGFGAQEIVASGDAMEDDADLALHLGAGLTVRIAEHLVARVDLRQIIVPNTKSSGASSDVELSAGVEWRFGASSRPSAPLVADTAAAADAAPATAVDTDGDGVVDERDGCPSDAEDLDGFEDGDGCPDVDNDGDGLLDGDDACRDQAETQNGYLDDDGCPDETLRELEGIDFEKNSARVTSGSKKLLDRAVELLKAHPEVRVEISGHSSDEGEGEGERRRNLRLSLERAAAVAAYLAGEGISPERIVAVGYGPDRPIADNRTALGRRQNRRIEFRVIAVYPPTAPAPAPR